MAEARKLDIVEYRPEWQQEFTAVAGELRDALGDLALRIDHIGSTSVPGLAAKDVLDVQVTVCDFTDDLDAAMLRSGKLAQTPYTVDHVPPTAAWTERDCQKRLYSSAPGVRRMNVHVRRAGSGNGRYALLFRDYLRAHPLAAAAYAQAKRALASYAPYDWDLYYDVKDPICDILMAGAEDWARMTGWHVGHYS